MPTPLYDALRAYGRQGAARFHMPGHKGRRVTPALSGAVELDLTELPDTGDLYRGGDVIAQAEALWARAWGLPWCQFLTGGSTQGLQAALLLCARRGRGVLVDRCSHRAVYNAMGLLGLEPVYLPRTQDRPLPAEEVARALDAAAAAGREIKTVCIPSPTYYGVLSDVAEIAAVCHRRGAWLVVDGAHGCHLPFLGPDPFLGADLVVSSAHKTLPVYGQGALLFSGGAVGPEELRWAALVWGTSSPAYPILAALDWAREWMTGEGREGWARAAAFTRRCRERFSALDRPELDPTRLTLVTRPTGEGHRAMAELAARGVVCEMADRDHVVLILTGADRPEDYRRLWAALEASGRFAPGGALSPLAPPPEPQVVLSPAQAMRARGVRRPLEACEGAVCLEQVAPYPPGVPVIAPGEAVTKKGLAYLREVGYNVSQMVSVRGRTGEEELP